MTTLGGVYYDLNGSRPQAGDVVKDCKNGSLYKIVEIDAPMARQVASKRPYSHYVPALLMPLDDKSKPPLPHACAEP